MSDQKTKLITRKFLYAKKNTKDNYIHDSERIVLLAILEHQDDYNIGIKQLSNELDVDYSNVSRTLKSLVNKGYLKVSRSKINFNLFTKTINIYKPTQALTDKALDWFEKRNTTLSKVIATDITGVDLTDPQVSDKLEAMKNIKIKNDLWE